MLVTILRTCIVRARLHICILYYTSVYQYELAHHVLYSSMHTVVVKALGMDMHIMDDSS